MAKETVDAHSIVISATSRNAAGTTPLFNAWISPAGKIIEVDIGYHSNYVVEFIEREYGKEWYLTMKMSSTRELYKFMEEHGWIRVMNWRSGDFIFVLPARAHTPHHQIKALIDICLNFNVPVPPALAVDE